MQTNETIAEINIKRTSNNNCRLLYSKVTHSKWLFQQWSITCTIIQYVWRCLLLLHYALMTSPRMTTLILKMPYSSSSPEVAWKYGFT